MTAGGQGIGRAIVEAFIAEGAVVIATDLDPGKLQGLKAAKLLKLDVRSTDAVNALAEAIGKELGALDVLTNIAGYVHQGTVFDCSEQTWDFSFDLNVKSLHRMITAFLPGMLNKGKGSIVNMSSAVSSIRGVPNRYVYGATKAAVIGLTKAVAADFIRQGVRCNAICPGTIKSPSLEERIAEVSRSTGRSLQAVERDFVNRQPMGRLGKPEEVAQLAVFLASDEVELHYRPRTSRRRRHGTMILRLSVLFAAAALLAASTAASVAQTCKRNGSAVTCDDGRVGTFSGDAIVWPDGTRSSAAPHPSVIIAGLSGETTHSRARAGWGLWFVGACWD